MASPAGFRPNMPNKAELAKEFTGSPGQILERIGKMAKALKWIDEKKEYIPYILPDGACLYTDNMEQEIACCQCGKKVKFGDCYTSRTIHTKVGLGYAECEDCYCKDLGSDSWKNT